MLKLTDEETENLNRFITNKQTNDKIESALRNSGQRKARAQTASLAIFTKHSENSSHFLTPLSRKGSVKKKKRLPAHPARPASRLVSVPECEDAQPQRKPNPATWYEGHTPPSGGIRPRNERRLGQHPKVRCRNAPCHWNKGGSRTVTARDAGGVFEGKKKSNTCRDKNAKSARDERELPQPDGELAPSSPGETERPTPSPRARWCRPLRYLPLGFSWSPSRGRSARRRRERHPAGRGRNKTTSVCR